jgi:hypothetical protein
MRIHTKTHWLPKAGNRSEEYEDACWPAQGGTWTGARFHCAVADGATESSFAGQWARQLVRAYGNSSMLGLEWLPPLAKEQARWRRTVQRKPLPWYAEEKVRNGAFAAFLGLAVTPQVSPVTDKSASGGAWTAVSVGDCCLFHLRGAELLRSFPAQESTFFTQRPFLLSSNPLRNDALAERLLTTTGQWQAGDTFYLMTDALALWALQRWESGAAPWDEVAALEGDQRQRRFGRWVEGLRASAMLRNDDVTLLAVQILE